MKITFDEILANKDLWMNSELLQSLSGEIIQKAFKDQFYEVKLVVNGIEVEPQIYNTIMGNIDSYIERKAEEIVRTKLYEADDAAVELMEAISQAKDSIREKFNI